MRFTLKKSLSIFLVVILLVVSFATFYTQKANAGLLSVASIELSDPRPSNSGTTYTIKYTFPGTTSIKCIDVIFADTTAHITLTANPATTAPSGMTTTSSVYGGTSGGGLTSGSWSLYSATNGILQFENSSGEASTATPITITATTNTNPSASTFYAQIATYSTLSTHTCSSLVDSSNVTALATTGGVSTSVTVDPTLSFSVAGYSGGGVNGGPATNPITTASSIAFGSVPAGGAATSAAQLLTTSTNAAGGYNLYVRNTQLLTNSNLDTIRAQSGTPGSPASFDGSSSQSSLAYTTDSSTIVMGSDQWAGLTTTNVAVDTQTAPQNAAALHVEYKLQLKSTQPPGTYSNVITYTATPTY